MVFAPLGNVPSERQRRSVRQLPQMQSSTSGTRNMAFAQGLTAGGLPLRLNRQVHAGGSAADDGHTGVGHAFGSAGSWIGWSSRRATIPPPARRRREY